MFLFINLNKSGANVTITNFADFNQFSAKNWRFSLKTNGMIPFGKLQQQYFETNSPFLCGENIFLNRNNDPRGQFLIFIPPRGAKFDPRPQG
jgi:hypothetical protein